MSAYRTVLVCLPAHTDPQQLTRLATTRLAAHGLRTHTAVPHFLPTRGRAPALLDRALLHHQPHAAAGGPIGLLDLNGMRTRAAAAASAHWQLWHDVVAGTRPAQPYWTHLQRHREDPDRYPLARVQQQYHTQPRIQAMTTFNALPHRPCDLPTVALEAFQAGQNTYSALAWLAAVPADGLATAPAHTRHDSNGDPASSGTAGRWLTPHTGALNHQLGYLRAANDHLAALAPAANLVALSVPV